MPNLYGVTAINKPPVDQYIALWSYVLPNAYFDQLIFLALCYYSSHLLASFSYLLTHIVELQWCSCQ